MTAFRTARLLSAAVGGLALVTLAGCSDSSSQLSEIRSNPTPELVTQSQRQDDVDNENAYVINDNMRMLNRDLGVLFLMDRPSRLSPAPNR